MLNVSYICVVFLILWNTVFDTLDNAFRVLKSKFKRLTNLSIVLVNDFHTPHPPPSTMSEIINCVSFQAATFAVMVLDCHPSSQTHQSFLSHFVTCAIPTANKRLCVGCSLCYLWSTKQRLKKGNRQA